MGYKRSVHCGHCGDQGHNRLGCPSRKQYALLNPESYLARELKYEANQRARAVASRTCTYCGDAGHNRRGCTALKKDKESILIRQSEYQDKFLKGSEAAGLAVGALLEIDHTDAYASGERWQQTSLAMITGISWQNIDFSFADDPYKTGYSLENTHIFNARVLNTRGSWPPFKREPEINSECTITLAQTAHLLPRDLFHEAARERFYGDDAPGRQDRSKLLSPVTGDASQEAHLNQNCRFLTYGLKKAFRLEPSPRENDRYYKERLSPMNGMWKNVYPESWEGNQP